jgi:hypothetical protein
MAVAPPLLTPSGCSHSIDTRRCDAGFHRGGEKRAASLKLAGLLARINPCNGREWARQTAMNDALSAAVIGAIAGYLIAQHNSEIVWILHTLFG